MLRLTTFIAALLLCQALATNSQQDDVQEVVKSNNAFSPSLYGFLRSEEGNLVVSTFNVFTGMSLAWLGADGDTAQQLQSSLHLPANRSQVKTGFKFLLISLQRTGNITLSVVNNLYLQRGFVIKDTYRQTAVDYFRSGFVEVNYRNETEAARITINQWVELVTQNQIRISIIPGILNEASLLAVVNVINFLGRWKTPFPEDSTRVETFHLTSRSIVNVSMMHHTDYFLYREVDELDIKALRLRYIPNVDDHEVDSMSMVILLPNTTDGWPQLESRIASVNITNITQQMLSTEVIVSLPRFNFDKSMVLNDTLKELGIINVLQDGANLSGITEDNVLISNVIHTASVQVTENGINAASSTGNVVQAAPWRVTENGTNAASSTNFAAGSSVPSVSPKRFNANHPFLFYILDDESGTILFMGRVVHPNKII